MSANYLASVPEAVLVHANTCATSPVTEINSAYLTGTVIGQAEGKQALHEALEADARHRAESFATDLGAAPTYPWEQPQWDRRKLAGPRPDTLTGTWAPKANPERDTTGPWPTFKPGTHYRLPETIAQAA
ncbi:hypothetical protein [uncultured Kocuria sp.]|uniref:hypothetical protein n=1 Tax=uncultured Kocuria sp. TaxID=259305 RepID=UPI0025979133|nr:hypothetical protein [uncultured Kocuria sp.]